MRLVEGAKPTHPTAHTRHARTAAQVHAPANTTLRSSATQNARAASRSAGDAPHNGSRISRAAESGVGWMRWLARLFATQKVSTSTFWW